MFARVFYLVFDESKAREWIENGPYTARSAKEAGLIDAIEHRQDFEAMLKQKFGEDVKFEKKYGQPKEELDLSSPMAMFKIPPTRTFPRARPGTPNPFR